MMTLDGKTIVVTGASDGIGRELTMQLAKRGANIVAAARSADKLNDLAGQCRDFSGEVAGISTDVSDPNACRMLVDGALQKFDGIDIFINNAGISMHARFDEITDLTSFENIMRVNYLGAVYCTHHALPHLQQSKGLLVAVSSLQGLTGFPRSTGYAASKHAMQGFFDSLRMELDGSGVDVLVVSPGAVDTAIHSRKFGNRNDGAQDSIAGDRNQMMPVDECARQMVAAIERRQRELVMTGAGRLLKYIRPFAPDLVDRQVAKSVARFYITES